jgi:hypothetical protein
MLMDPFFGSYLPASPGWVLVMSVLRLPNDQPGPYGAGMQAQMRTAVLPAHKCHANPERGRSGEFVAATSVRGKLDWRGFRS